MIVNDYVAGVTDLSAKGLKESGGTIMIMGAVTDTQYLKRSGSTIISGAPGGGGGLSDWTEGQSTTSPNNTVYTSSFTATGGVSNIDAVIIPKGTGALLTAIPDSSSTGGNKRGAYAVDLQLIRSAASQVASGIRSTIIGGSSNTASGNYSVVGGVSNSDSGNYSAIIGGGSNVNTGVYCAVVAGLSHTISNHYTFIGSGYQNTVSGKYGATIGGRFNTANNSSASVIASYNSTASGTYSNISGSINTTVSGNYGSAIGSRGSTASGTCSSTIASGSATSSGQYCLTIQAHISA